MTRRCGETFKGSKTDNDLPNRQMDVAVVCHRVSVNDLMQEMLSI